MARPQRKVEIQWSSDFSYALGLLSSDGSLSKDGRHIDFTSKDREQVINFKKCLGLHTTIGSKYVGKGGRYFRIQFGDVVFYRFLLDLGLTPAKSETIAAVQIPDEFFFDFLRGIFDGDGCFYSYWDRRWRSSFMYYTVFNSASMRHVQWLRERIHCLLNISGHINRAFGRATPSVKYGKFDSIKLLSKMYYSDKVVCLARKRAKIDKALLVTGESL